MMIFVLLTLLSVTQVAPQSEPFYNVQGKKRNGNLQITVPSEDVGKKLTLAVSGKLGSFCLTVQPAEVAEESSFLWCSYKNACLSSDPTSGVNLFSLMYPDPSNVGDWADSFGGVPKTRVEKVTCDELTRHSDSDYPDMRPQDGGGDVNQRHVVEASRSMLEQSECPKMKYPWMNKLVTVNDVYYGKELTSTDFMTTDAAKVEFLETVDMNRVADGKLMDKDKKVFWATGLGVVVGRGVKWNSYAHRLQPYLDSITAWHFAMHLNENTPYRRGTHSDESSTARYQGVPYSPDAAFIIREDVSTEVARRFFIPVLARHSNGLNITSSEGPAPEWKVNDECDNSSQECGLGNTILPSLAGSWLLSAEAVNRLSTAVGQDALICMDEVVHTAPLRGSQYAPLSVDQHDIDRVHRRYATYFEDQGIKNAYARGGFPRYDWRNEKCTIRVIQRKANNRVIKNQQELLSSLKDLIAKNALFDGKDVDMINVQLSTWDGSDDAVFQQMIREAVDTCILIVVHGADLINAMHLRPGSLVIELNPSRYHWPRLKMSISQMDVDVVTVWMEETVQTKKITTGSVLDLARDVNTRNTLLLAVNEFTILPAKVLGHVENYFLSRIESSVYQQYYVKAPQMQTPWMRTPADERNFRRWKRQGMKHRR